MPCSRYCGYDGVAEEGGEPPYQKPPAETGGSEVLETGGSELLILPDADPGGEPPYQKPSPPASDEGGAGGGFGGPREVVPAPAEPDTPRLDAAPEVDIPPVFELG